MCRAARPLLIATLLLAIASIVQPAWAQGPENVAIVINGRSEDSLRIGEHYAQVRGLPSLNVIRIDTATGETIDRAAYVRTIQDPIAAAIAKHGLQDRLLYLVLTKDIPLRIAGTGGPNGTAASVDSELTLLYRRMTGRVVPLDGRVDNPYFLGAREVGQARRFSRRDHDIYLVTRLDAFTPDEAIQLVERGRAPVQQGAVVLDRMRSGPSGVGDGWLGAAAQRLDALGHDGRAALDGSARVAAADGAVLGYYSWGSIDPRLRARQTGLRFVPGALAVTFVGSAARTFAAPAEQWTPTNDSRPGAAFAGTAQSLLGDLLREGATGAAGYVADPLLQGAVRPDILFPAYFSGFNLVEAFYLSLPHLSWHTVIVGDPLCAPFDREPLPLSEIDAGIDEATTLPALFSTRRTDVVSAAFKIDHEAAGALVQAETFRARGEVDRARAALERATVAAPALAAPHLQLALIDEVAGNSEAALARYRRVLEIDPRNLVALNNLAYGLAVRANAPEEARPFAVRAATLAPANPTVADTLGWIEYLLGNHASARRLLAEAARAAPDNADIRLHAAFALAAVGETDDAANHLSEALRLTPDLASQPEVEALRVRLGLHGR